MSTTDESATVPSAVNGRDDAGRFSRGNQFARGNPTARHAQRLRQLFIVGVTEDDIKTIVSKLVEMAKDGDIQAANLLLTRALGKPSTTENSLPLDSVPIVSFEQIKTLDDAREFALRCTPDISDECLETKAGLFMKLVAAKLYD